MYKTLQKAENTHNLLKSEILHLLNIDDATELFNSADKVRKKYVGDEIFLRGLIEFSNHCKNNCQYCGLRHDNFNIRRYRIDIKEIIEMSAYAKSLGLMTIVLQSGDDDAFDEDKMLDLIKGIKALDLALTLSVGEKSFDEYKKYREYGADRFLIRIETTDKELYKSMHPNNSWENRKTCMQNLKKLGYELGSGCLVGLPNQTMESLADDILFLKEMSCDMIGVGPFIPHPDTPLKNAQGRDLETALRVMAIIRLLLPDINIPATTAMETLAPNGQIKALQSGANVIMPNVTLKQYREHYQLYQGKTSTGQVPSEGIRLIHEKIKSIGRYVGTGLGQSKKWLKEQNS